MISKDIEPLLLPLHLLPGAWRLTSTRRMRPDLNHRGRGQAGGRQLGRGRGESCEGDWTWKEGDRQGEIEGGRNWL